MNGDACTQQVYTLPGYKKPALPTNINYMGCFTDTGNRAVENYRGDVSYSGRGIDGKTACMNKAIQNGDNIFAVQCSGPPTGNCHAPGVAQCFTGQDSEYDQFGANSKCTNMGDAWTNQVYTIGNLEPAAPFSGQYNTIPNMDRGGADIGCIGNQGDAPCKIACDSDPKCVAWNSIAGGHCCWKNKKSPKGPNSAVIFHEKIGKGKKSGPILFENPTLKQNNLIGVISGATPNYIISFDVTPLGTAGQGDYASIIRFTFASNGAYDDANDFQAPGIFFRTGTTKLAINIGVVNGDYSRFISDPLPLNIPTSVVINCQGVTSTISINGVVKYNTNTPRHLPNGRPLYVFAGDAKFPSANATVKNLTYTIL